MTLTMAIGPSRRSSALPPSSGPAKRDLPNSRAPNSFREHRRDRFLYLKLSPRRVPFNLWLLFVSMYCCTMYLSTVYFRALQESAFQGAHSKDSIPPQTDVGSRTQPSQEEASIAKKEKEKKQNNEFHMNKEMIHVVETRFMQHQSRLIELGLARLALFQVFCLPTMLTQTNPNFIWIIRADPDLHPSIVSSLVHLMDGKQNFILIGSNANPEGFGRDGGSFEDFLMDFTQDPAVRAPVWSGNISLVEEAYERSAAGAVLLETRLDADDGLHCNFIKTVQNEASKSLWDSDHEEESNEKWRLWCVHSNIEWHPLNPFPETPLIKSANESIQDGYLVMYADSGVCSTPGLTFGYGRGASRATMGFERLNHNEIVKKIKSCSMDPPGIKCVSRLQALSPGAIRARTTTSAGMKNVVTGNSELDKGNGLKLSRNLKNEKFMRQLSRQDKLWDGTQQVFSVFTEEVKYARSIIVERSAEIAEDNLRGQCTKGHSCKNGTKLMLAQMSKVAA